MTACETVVQVQLKQPTPTAPYMTHSSGVSEKQKSVLVVPWYCGTVHLI